MVGHDNPRVKFSADAFVEADGIGEEAGTFSLAKDAGPMAFIHAEFELGGETLMKFQLKGGGPWLGVVGTPNFLFGLNFEFQCRGDAVGQTESDRVGAALLIPVGKTILSFEDGKFGGEP